MSKIQSYQGELLKALLVQKAFNEKLKAAKTNRKNVDNQDWSGFSAILDKLVERFRCKLSSLQQHITIILA